MAGLLRYTVSVLNNYSQKLGCHLLGCHLLDSEFVPVSDSVERTLDIDLAVIPPVVDAPFAPWTLEPVGVSATSALLFLI